MGFCLSNYGNRASISNSSSGSINRLAGKDTYLRKQTYDKQGG